MGILQFLLLFFLQFLKDNLNSLCRRELLTNLNYLFIAINYFNNQNQNLIISIFCFIFEIKNFGNI